MALYKCKVVDGDGNRKILKIQSQNETEAIKYLRQNNYLLIEVKETFLLFDPESFNKSKIKSKDLSVFCKQMYSMLKAGVTIVSALEILRVQTENKFFKKLINKMYEDLLKGKTFSEALTAHKNFFPDIFISMIEAGEVSGNIDTIMNRLSVFFEKENKIENKIKSALTYPIVLAVISVLVVVFLLITVMPMFASMYESSGATLPWITRALLGLSYIVSKYYYLIAIIIFVLVLAILELLKKPNIKYKVDYYKLHVPVIKNLELKVVTLRFTRTLSTLLGSGVPLLQSLDTVSGVTGNYYVKSKIIEAKEDVRKGMALSTPLKRQGIFAPMVYSMIKIGEDSGTIEEILDKTADFYDEEVDRAVDLLTDMIEPAMIVLMAIVIGFIVLAMVTPMFGMFELIQ